MLHPAKTRLIEFASLCRPTREARARQTGNLSPSSAENRARGSRSDDSARSPVLDRSRRTQDAPSRAFQDVVLGVVTETLQRYAALDRLHLAGISASMARRSRAP